MLKPLFILVASCFLFACTPSPIETYATYQSRLAKFLPVSERSNIRLQTLPALRIETINSTQSISILNLAQLNHCALSSLVAQHNNQLGKVASASELLKYHLAFIQGVEPCLAQPKSKEVDKDIVRALQNAKQEKQTQLALYFNAMLANEHEFKRLFSLSGSELKFDENAGRSDTIEALTQLANIADAIAQQQWHSIDVGNITTALALLNGNDYLRKLLTSAQKQQALNTQLTEQLAQVDPAHSLCKPKHNRDEANIVHSVFSHFYLEQLQAYQSQINGALFQIEPLLGRVLQFYPDDEPLKVKLLGGENSQSLQQALSNSSKNHIYWWQGFFKQCDLRPGGQK